MHAAENRADNYSEDARSNRNFKRQIKETRRDDPNCGKLCDKDCKGTDQQNADTEEAREPAAEPHVQKIGNRVDAEFSEVGCEQDRGQNKSTGPADDKGQTVVTQ